MKWTPLITGLALIAVALPAAPAAATGQVTQAVSATGTDTIDWRACGEEPGAECGALAVPVDWEKPDGPRISLNMTRRKATGQRVGTLFYNPGGPGAGAAYLVRNWSQYYFSEELRERFDIVGIDPRGVAGSGQIQCGKAVHDPAVTQFPETRWEYDRLVAHNRAVGVSCGPLIGHVDTGSVARDFDAVRAALGEEQISYLGRSYGSMLGTEYARRFPDRVRAMALDGIVDHGMSSRQMVRDAATAVEDGFDRFGEWCERTEECELHGRSVPQVWDALMRKAEKTPIPVTGGRPLTAEELRYAAYVMLTLAPEFNGDLARGIVQAEQGDAEILGQMRTEALDNSAMTSAYRAVLCQDIDPGTNGFSQLRAWARDAARRAPHMRGTSEFWDMTTGCLGWPVQPSNPQRPVRITQVPPVLLVGNTHDPATPLVWAKSLARGIKGSQVLTYDGDGHTAYLRNACATGSVDRYLISGTLPVPGTVCR
ncbi:alpha/beta hydrolase [Streptosporangium sp. NPDC020145]|uniref:alpha/beta hydrolase n=1 Tax=Streptosporangium sp. NPDC020145 TaxID=3154694 RepID=UPI00341C9A21